MKRFFLLILIFFYAQAGHSQAELKTDFDNAVALLKAKNYNKAAESFTALLGKANDDELKKFCHIYRAFSYNGLGEFNKAIADLDKAIEIDPADLRSYIDRGLAKGYANDLEGAKEDFLFILTRDSTGEQGQTSIYYLAVIAYQQGKFYESIQQYDKLILLVPGDPELYFNRASAKGMLMDPEGSIQDYDKAISLNGNYMEAYANRGVAKINLLRKQGSITPTGKQTADACSDLKRARQLGDTTVDDMIFIHCK